MHPQIKEIALQVGGSHYPEVGGELLEKFAHAVVKECCEVAHCNFHVDGLTLGNILKQHFGIKND
jgi:hypothetical protein